MAARVYITGAAGSGCSTLGRALAEARGLAHLDIDDFYWRPSEPPFTDKHPPAERVAMIATAQASHPEGWVLSGSADGWGDTILGDLDLIVFLSMPAGLRLARLRRREAARFGDRIKPGGDMVQIHQKFLKWAASYDDPYFSGRSWQRHQSWLVGQKAPVLRLNAASSLEALLSEVLAQF